MDQYLIYHGQPMDQYLLGIGDRYLIYHGVDLLGIRDQYLIYHEPIKVRAMTKENNGDKDLEEEAKKVVVMKGALFTGRL
ncbi:hypothetical protein AKJ16_DCAP03593 [Drosera capensis]